MRAGARHGFQPGLRAVLDLSDACAAKADGRGDDDDGIAEAQCDYD